MKKDLHFPSRMLACAGGLMAVSGVLMAVCGRPAYGGVLWAAASCMFLSARQFHLAENQKETEELEDEQETL